MEMADFHIKCNYTCLENKLKQRLPDLSKVVSVKCFIVYPSNLLRNGFLCKGMILTSPFVS